MVETRRFVCPSCTAVLNQDDPDSIRFKATLRGPAFVLETTFELPSQLGVYGATSGPGLRLEEGCRVDFGCPHCGHDFTTSANDDLAQVEMVDGGQTYVVVFSKIFGEHSSFVVDSSTKKLIASYGEDADTYIDELGKSINFFGS
jgi:hypothetical protein